MPSVREAIRFLFAPVRPLPPGIFNYQSPPEGSNNYRLHLRLEADGSGLLVVNASTILHLNQTAAEYAYHLVHQTSAESVARLVTSRYRVAPQQALRDYRDLKERIDLLLSTSDLDPETFMDFGRAAPVKLSSPIRLICALTYQLPENVNPDYSPSKRVKRELSTLEWQTILDKSWQAGIPHLIFTGGEPTLRKDLVDLVHYAEEKGQVTGLLSDGLKLGDFNYLNKLLLSGLDHLLFLLQPRVEASWQALKTVLEVDLFVVVHLTITPTNQEQARGWLEQLKNMGVHTVSLSSSEEDLKETLLHMRNQAAELDLKIVWDLPVPFSALNPVTLESGSEPENSGSLFASLYVEPDGDVLLSQDDRRVFGNLLADSWEQIWNRLVDPVTTA